MNSRRKFLINSSVAGSALFVAKPLKTFARFSSPFSSFGGEKITLLHTYDLHSTVYACPSALQQANNVISDLKKEGNCVLLDTGTNYSGSALQQGEDLKTLELMKSMGYDVALTGSPSFNGSLITDNTTGSAQPYRIINKGATRIGVIGAWVNRNGGHNISNPVQSLTEIATKLKKEQNCNLVICLSNFGYQNKKSIDDITLATQSKNIDVIIGSQPAEASSQLPSILLNKDNEEVVINNAGSGNIVLGRISVGFDSNGRKNHISFANIAANPGKKPLAALSA